MEIRKAIHLLSNVRHTACPAQFPLFLVAACGCRSLLLAGATDTHVLHMRGFQQLPASMLHFNRLCRILLNIQN